MVDDTKTTPKTAQSKPSGAQARSEYPPPKGPDFIVYAVRDRDSARAVWTRIGAAFKHDNGSEGLNILLDALPVGRKIVLMPPKEDETA